MEYIVYSDLHRHVLYVSSLCIIYYILCLLYILDLVYTDLFSFITIIGTLVSLLYFITKTNKITMFIVFIHIIQNIALLFN